MNIPLNIDWQQILLHWMNLAILAGGLYFLLYKPVKDFMARREAHYQELEEEARARLRQADELKEQYRAQLDGAEEEIAQSRSKAQQDLQKSVQEQLDQAQRQAAQIVSKAREEAEYSRERTRKESQRELRELATAAARKLVFQPDADPFDQFLNLAEGGGADESR